MDKKVAKTITIDPTLWGIAKDRAWAHRVSFSSLVEFALLDWLDAHPESQTQDGIAVFAPVEARAEPKPVQPAKPAPKPEPTAQTIGFSKAQQAGRKEPVAKKRW